MENSAHWKMDLFLYLMPNTAISAFLGGNLWYLAPCWPSHPDKVAVNLPRHLAQVMKRKHITNKIKYSSLCVFVMRHCGHWA